MEVRSTTPHTGSSVVNLAGNQTVPSKEEAKTLIKDSVELSSKESSKEQERKRKIGKFLKRVAIGAIGSGLIVSAGAGLNAGDAILETAAAGLGVWGTIGVIEGAAKAAIDKFVHHKKTSIGFRAALSGMTNAASGALRGAIVGALAGTSGGPVAAAIVGTLMYTFGI